MKKIRNYNLIYEFNYLETIAMRIFSKIPIKIILLKLKSNENYEGPVFLQNNLLMQLNLFVCNFELQNKQIFLVQSFNHVFKKVKD
ncbi:hypothetical protein BpHYR1_033480 [Brachionus plicatilis]|uniref:Uncharacterized protein n=1 Tax=Brachionus plicatilis TaxID=10195 RepID=A0A3M7QWB1_BRAPC|nr:hypothetical protein BpHYR1_033480 [Brachionus plicatilis]